MAVFCDIINHFPAFYSVGFTNAGRTGGSGPLHP